MAKQKEEKQLTRRQVTRHEKETQAQQTITRIAIAIVTVIVLVTAYGIISETIKARRPVARIDETYINTREFGVRQYYQRWLLRMQEMQYSDYIAQIQQSMLEAGPQPEGEEDPNEAFLQQIQLTQANLTNQLSYDYANLLSGQILDMMIEEELIRIEAETRGLTLTEEAIDRAIEMEMGYDRDTAALAASGEITDTTGITTEADFVEYYEQFKAQALTPAHLKEADFREMIRANLLREQIINDLSGNETEPVDQVQTITFSVDSVETGVTLQERINAGIDDPTALLEELNADLENGISGYELPFLPAGYMASQFTQDIERAAFNTPVGKASEPLMGPGETYFVMYVLAHEEQELSPDIFGDTANQKYDEWLTEQLEARTEYLEWEQAVITEP